MQRVPWADKYGDVDSIPVEEWLNHGWYFTCDTCGAEIDDIKDFHVNRRGYCCKKCFNEWVESGREKCNMLQKSLLKVARGDRKSPEKVKEMKE